MINQIPELISIAINNMGFQDFENLLIIYISLVFAFTVRVITGFGSALLLSPILSILINPKEAVVLIVFFESVINGVFSIKEKITFTLKEVYLGAFSGILIGIFLFSILSGRVVGMGIGLSMMILSIAMMKGINYYIRAEGVFFYFLGLISGSMGVLTGVNGPQIVLGMMNQRYNPVRIRNFVITYFIIIDTITLIAFILFGYVNMRILVIFLTSIPFIYLSYLAGIRIFERMNRELLRKALLVIVMLSSTSLFIKSISGL